MSAARTASPRVQRSRACPVRDLPRRSRRGGPAAGRSRGSPPAALARCGGAATQAPRQAAKLPRAEDAEHLRRWPGSGAGARHAVAFTHPGSPRVHHYGEDGQACLVMEPAAGPLEAETGRRTLVTDRSGVCLPAGAPTRYG